MQDTLANLIPPDADPARRTAIRDALEFISGWRHPGEVPGEVTASAVV